MISHPPLSAGNTTQEPVPGWYGSEFDPDGQVEDPHTGFRQLRETQPVNLTPEGTWRLSRYDDIRRLLRNVPSGVRTTRGLIPGRSEEIPGAGLFMLMQDPPTHTRLRKLVAKAFTPRAVESWHSRIDEITQRRLDLVERSGSMDLIADLALPVPATLICNLLGIPAPSSQPFASCMKTHNSETS